jgi:dihydroxyacetone kinase
MHAGLIGEGLLTAAVCGRLFASPSIDAVLAAILHVTGQAGTLVIVKAYTGDCLNFGLAVERARALGLRVEMVIFSDDISNPGHPRPRGLAGVVLLEKVCGYFAESKLPLSGVKSIADRLCASISTLGIALTSCSLPESPISRRIDSGSAELGLGIHGEPGVEVLTTHNSDEIVKIITDRLRAVRKGPLAVLLNNLGGTSQLEMSIIAASLLRVPRLDIKVLVGPASVCTSLDMKGFSISFLELGQDDKLSEALLAPAAAHGWVPATTVHPPLDLPPRNQVAERPFSTSKSEVPEKLLRAICSALEEATGRLNALDAKIGDGDTGTTFSAGARAILAELPKLPLADTAELFQAISGIVGAAMGGSSGVLLAIGLLQAGKEIQAGTSLPEAIAAGARRMAELGGAQLGSRTMLDALIPAAEALKSGFAQAAEAAEKGAAETAGIEKAKAGRASYLLAETLAGHPDPGAVAIGIIFRAIASAL